MGDSCSFGFKLTYLLFVFCLIVILVISHFGFEGGTLVLIASVPGHYLSFTSEKNTPISILCWFGGCNAHDKEKYSKINVNTDNAIIDSL